MIFDLRRLSAKTDTPGPHVGAAGCGDRPVALPAPISTGHATLAVALMKPPLDLVRQVLVGQLSDAVLRGTARAGNARHSIADADGGVRIIDGDRVAVSGGEPVQKNRATFPIADKGGLNWRLLQKYSGSD